MKNKLARLMKVHDRAYQILNTINEHEIALGANTPALKNVCSFAFAEHAAHDAVYNLPTSWDHVEVAPEVSIFDADGHIRTYNANQFLTNHRGLVGYVLTGTDKTNSRVHVLFRGTKDGHSAQCDLETPAPGFNTFQTNVPVILAQLEAALQALNIPNVILSIGGHSLGGAFAQYCMNAVMQTLALQAQEDKTSALSKISELHLFHLNSAGVDQKTCAESKMYAQYLSAETQLKIYAKVLRVAGDPIQFGRNILHNVAADVAEIVLMKINSGHEGWLSNIKMAGLFIATATVATMTPGIAAVGLTTYTMLAGNAGFKAHTAHHFKDKATDQVPFEIFDNSTIDGQQTIANKLSKQATSINGSFTSSLKDMLHDRTPSPEDPRFQIVKRISHERRAINVPENLSLALNQVLCNKQTQITRNNAELALQAAHIARMQLLKQTATYLAIAGTTLVSAFLLSRVRQAHNVAPNASTYSRSLTPTYAAFTTAILAGYTIYNSNIDRPKPPTPKPGMSI